MYARSIRITLKPNVATSVLELYGVVGVLAPNQFTAPERLYIAHRILAGEGWEPEPSILALYPPFKEDPRAYKLLDTVVEDPDHFTERNLLLEKQHAILKRACAGDAEAAFEYCRMEMAGEIYHGAWS